MEKYACPCCGYKTFDHKPGGTYDICPVCFWEDDLVQLEHPDYTGGANGVSLREAQQNFLAFGACEQAMTAHVRPPIPGEERDEHSLPPG